MNDKGTKWKDGKEERQSPNKVTLRLNRPSLSGSTFASLSIKSESGGVYAVPGEAAGRKEGWKEG